MNWLETKLTEKGFTAISPDFPMSWNPKYAEWKKTFEEYPVTTNTLLVGHSCGGAFLVRYLLKENKKVKKLILVAPAKVPEGDTDARKNLYDFNLPLNASHIADDIVIFTSNDFPHHLKSLEMYKKSLRPRIIKLENKFHFLFFQMKTNEFPELLEEIVNP
ncbi:MAG TPA: alpha/beta fold hydrolase [Bacteroidia bacterium]|nr:alpha/beta fold hydrolase [Bacteroidia bacterium]